MKKSRRFLRFLVVMCIVVIGVLYLPSDKVKVTEEQKEELTHYVEQIYALNLVRTDIIKNYQKEVLEPEETTESYRNLEEEIVPLFENYQTQVKKISFTDSNIKQVHQLYLLATDKQNKSFHLYVQSYREQQKETYEQANTLLKESDALYQDFDTKLRALTKDYDITLPK